MKCIFRSNDCKRDLKDQVIQRVPKVSKRYLKFKGIPQVPNCPRYLNVTLRLKLKVYKMYLNAPGIPQVPNCPRFPKVPKFPRYPKGT